MEAAVATRVQALGVADYAAVAARMRAFTEQRLADTPDELWVVEHPPVYTLGQGADEKFGPRVANGIPVVRSERGGEITYHGPGQAVVYTLVDLQRRGIKVKEFVRLLEQGVIDLLGAFGVAANRRPGAPGVYVGEAKIAALGIRVTRGRAWHGVALNVDMDLSPFRAIDPCGYPGLEVTQAKDLGIRSSAQDLGLQLARLLEARLEHA
ncbi:MAG: lipoyl(octanoyl) transferase LipB [Betaproteobacteria bacterium]|nr:lipoyl(octanoyl) transferase LipB [Betaproteobacteria bacterium]MDH5222386.1 lipoyl(octanoyl) transferase LipB [Betaproteobacteria bacterium]MDH5349396.1 lipoyl(octanoyl) transferase LipB [Betaproteobacteria bacterium]